MENFENWSPQNFLAIQYIIIITLVLNLNVWLHIAYYITVSAILESITNVCHSGI